MTLQQLADKLGVHPYDITGDKELADDLLDGGVDITDTIFYQELVEEFGPHLINLGSA